MSDVTRMIQEGKTAEELLPLVYAELRQLAQSRMKEERRNHTLQATALVHDAFIRLMGSDGNWENRGHFFAAAAEAMRRILIEHARAKRGPRRGGNKSRLPLGVVDLAVMEDPEQIMAVDEAVSRLEKEAPETARVVRLRFYAGLSNEETAKALGISERSVRREWSFARAFLFRVLEEH